MVHKKNDKEIEPNQVSRWFESYKEQVNALFPGGVMDDAVKTSQALGYFQLKNQYSERNPKIDMGNYLLANIDASGWSMLAKINPTLPASEADYDMTSHYTSFQYYEEVAGSFSDSGVRFKQKPVLLEVLASMKASEETKTAIKQVLIEGYQPKDVTDSPSASQRVKKAISRVLFNVEAIKSEYALKSLREDFAFRVKPYFSDVDSAAYLLGYSRQMIREIFADMSKAERSDLMIMLMIWSLGEKKLEEIFSVIKAMTDRIERFTIERYVILRKLAPLIAPEETVFFDDGKSPRPPKWLSFLEGSETARPPSLMQLYHVYKHVLCLDKQSDAAIKKELRRYYGDNARIRVFSGKRVYELVQSGMTVNEALRKAKIEGDVALAYRTFKAWVKQYSHCVGEVEN
jgi:hypothetical protein